MQLLKRFFSGMGWKACFLYIGFTSLGIYSAYCAYIWWNIYPDGVLPVGRLPAAVSIASFGMVISAASRIIRSLKKEEEG